MGEWDRMVDVVVVGQGIAGACAALEAHRAGAEVLVRQAAWCTSLQRPRPTTTPERCTQPELFMKRHPYLPDALSPDFDLHLLPAHARLIPLIAPPPVRCASAHRCVWLRVQKPLNSVRACPFTW